jgi:riboflavin synthase
MFTGIIEAKGTITDISISDSNYTFWIESSLSSQLKIDQSLSHNGVCLTVEEIKSSMHRVTAIQETLQKTNLGNLSVGSVINLERCMTLNGRIDGHIVQGHVDTTGVCKKITNKKGSWEYLIEINPSFAGLIIEKGSICMNGISLTIFNVTKNSFTVAIIPYTFEHTNIHLLIEGATVNIEFDMIGKYVNRLQSLQKQAI